MDNLLSVWLGALTLLIILIVTGSGDYEEAVAAERHYCKMVASKVWPAYDQNINCNKE